MDVSACGSTLERPVSLVFNVFHMFAFAFHLELTSYIHKPPQLNLLHANLTEEGRPPSKQD